jgi:hypothetical protein
MRHIGLTALLPLPVGGLAAGWSDYGFPVQGNRAVLQLDAVAMGRATLLGRCTGKARHAAFCPPVGPGLR